MARFYGSIVGQARTAATRRGSKTSGITAHIHGWDIGVLVYGDVEQGDDGVDYDVFHVYLTGGTHNPKEGKAIGRFTTKREVKT